MRNVGDWQNDARIVPEKNNPKQKYYIWLILRILLYDPTFRDGILG